MEVGCTMKKTSDLTKEEYDMLMTRADKSLKAPWKSLPKPCDTMPKMSYSQEKLLYIAPEPDTIPIEFRNTKGDFSTFLNKAVELNVNLKSTAH